MIIYCKNAMFNTNHVIYIGMIDDKRLGAFLDSDNEPICYLITYKEPKGIMQRIAEEVRNGTQIFNLQELEG